MTQLPRISIVTPSFNQAPFLEACLDSVLSQGYPNLEYIVMDGGSTDGSVEIIRKYERHLAYWQTQPDGGHYAAVAAGFGRTTGEILAWLNADDKYCPLAFFKVAYLFTTSPAEWITGRPLRWSREGHAEDVCGEPFIYSREKVVLRKQFRTPWVCQESTFWRRSLWERAGGGPRSDLKLAGDLELWVRFFRFAALYSVEALLGGNRRHADQRSVLFLDEYLREAEALLAEELARPAPAESFAAPVPLTVDPDGFRALLAQAAVPASTVAADELTADLVAEVVRLSEDRHAQLDANQRIERAMLESEADRGARLQAIHALGAQLADSDADRQARLQTIEVLSAQLAESEADRQARLDNMRRLEGLLQDAVRRGDRLSEDLATVTAARDCLEARVQKIEKSAVWRAAEGLQRLGRVFRRRTS